MIKEQRKITVDIKDNKAKVTVSAPLKASEYREKIYQFINDIIGRDLTEHEHKVVRGMMIEYVQGHATGMAQKRMEHTYICRDCLKKVVKVGRSANHNFNKRNKSSIDPNPAQ